MTDDGATTSAVFAFDEAGRVTGMTAKRYFGGSGQLETWGGRIRDWKTFDGIEVASRGDVVWSLKDGEFTFYRWEISEIEPNVRSLYGEPARGLAASGVRDQTPRPGSSPHAR